MAYTFQPFRFFLRVGPFCFKTLGSIKCLNACGQNFWPHTDQALAKDLTVPSKSPSGTAGNRNSMKM